MDVGKKKHTNLDKISHSSLPLTVCLFTTELEPYKYAGYPMLIKTITMETEDSQLFSKTSPLLPAAVELAFHTVNCSALNAEELRRDNGIEVHVDSPRGVKSSLKLCGKLQLVFCFFGVNQVLLEALSRCVSVLTASSKPDDMAVQVGCHKGLCNPQQYSL